MLFSLKLTPKFPDIQFRFRPDISSDVRSNPTKYYDILCCLTGCDGMYVYVKGLFAYLPKQWPYRAPWHFHSRQKVCACALMKTCYNRNGDCDYVDSIFPNSVAKTKWMLENTNGRTARVTAVEGSNVEDESAKHKWIYSNQHICFQRCWMCLPCHNECSQLHQIFWCR